MSAVSGHESSGRVAYQDHHGTLPSVVTIGSEHREVVGVSGVLSELNKYKEGRIVDSRLERLKLRLRYCSILSGSSSSLSSSLPSHSDNLFCCASADRDTGDS